MPVDGGGNVTRPASPLPVTGQTADAPQVNVPVDDIYNIMNMLVFLDGRKTLRGNIPMNGYRASGAGNAVSPQDYVPLSQVESLIASIVTVPTGIIVPMTSTVVPPGWLVVNGQSVTRAAYPSLWAHAQASGLLAATEGAKTHGQFGPGNGTTTFSLPNVAVDDGYFIRPTSAGRVIGTIQADDIRSHTHTATFAGVAVPPHSHTYATARGGGGFDYGGGIQSTAVGSTDPAGGHTPSGSVTVNAFGGSETRPKNIAYPYIIKT